jgi:hypothetical protein
MFFDVLLSKLFYKEKVHKFQQIYGKIGGVANREQRSRSRSRRGGVSENQIAGVAAARLFFLTAVTIAIATRPFKFLEISVSNTSSSFVSSIHSFAFRQICSGQTVSLSRLRWNMVKVYVSFPQQGLISQPWPAGAQTSMLQAREYR